MFTTRGPETGNFYESLGARLAGLRASQQPPGSHSAIEWGAMETQERNAGEGGGEGVGGLTKQCSSGVPNTEPQLAAGPHSHKTGQPVSQPASLTSPARQFGDREGGRLGERDRGHQQGTIPPTTSQYE